MSQYRGLPSDRGIDQPAPGQIFQTLIEARREETFIKKPADTSGFRCCYVSPAQPDSRTGTITLIPLN